MVPFHIRIEKQAQKGVRQSKWRLSPFRGQALATVETNSLIMVQGLYSGTDLKMRGHFFRFTTDSNDIIVD